MLTNNCKLITLCGCLFLLLYTSCRKAPSYPDEPVPGEPCLILASGRTYLAPAADAYVRSGSYRYTNFGGEKELVVKNDDVSGSYAREAFLKFDLKDIRNCLSATLRLTIAWGNTDVGLTTWDLTHIEDDNWSGDSITWMNKPACDYSIGTLPGKNTGAAEWDVTDAVFKELKGDKVLSMQIISTLLNAQSDAAFYSSRSGHVQCRPVLIIDQGPHRNVYTLDIKPAAAREAYRLGQRLRASDFIPTGFYLPANTPLTVSAEQLSGHSLPKILVGTYGRNANKSKPAEISLRAGENTISDPQGGLIYIRYVHETQDDNSSARVSFEKGYKLAPFYVLGQTTYEQWQQMLTRYTDAPDVQLEGQHAFIVASLNKALAYRNEDLDKLLNTIDKVLDAEAAISGLDSTTTRHKRNVHKILMTETDRSSVYMEAGWYYTAYASSVMDRILTVQGIIKNGWGPWHELGHMHQQDAWTWDQTVEVTVNIYSLAAERALGILPSRMKEHTAATKNYLNRVESQRDYNGSGASFWVRLYMFHQLWMAFGDAFYHELHKVVRRDWPKMQNTEQRMRYFMLTACDITQNDLSDFFKKWGLKVNDSVYQEIAAKGYPKPSYDIANVFE